MKKILLITPMLFLLTSCFTVTQIQEISGLNDNTTQSIPLKSDVILIEKKCDAETLYNEIYSVLIDRGHRIEESNKEQLHITTEGKNVGESIMQRMTILIKEKDNISTAKIKTGWNTTVTGMQVGGFYVPSEWDKATWETSQRYALAFAESVNVALSIDNAQIKYEGAPDENTIDNKKTNMNTSSSGR